MKTPRFCPYCREEVRRTRPWYRNAPDVEFPVTQTPIDGDDIAEYDPMDGVDEMIMAMPCRHSFEADRWDRYKVACVTYSGLVDEIRRSLDMGKVVLLRDALDSSDIELRARCEETCETMERTPPKGVLTHDV